VIVSFRNLGLRSTVSAQKRFAGKLSCVEVIIRIFYQLYCFDYINSYDDDGVMMMIMIMMI
jgi:hypothetical protein